MRLFLLLICASLHLQAGEIALSFDDAPRGDSHFQSGQARTKMLIGRLKEADVAQAIFFSISRNLERPHGIERMAAYAEAGHLVGNHTHSHQWIHRIGMQAYVEDIRKAHERLRDLPGFVPYFRYPFLNQGRAEERWPIWHTWEQLGYHHGYVTVDNYDWYMDSLFNKALGEGHQVDMAKLKAAYIDILWDCISFYDQLAQQYLGRSPKHMLLLHENDLAALFIGDLVAHIRAQGWRIIGVEEAYRDPLSVVCPKGVCNQGRIACIAQENQHRGWTGHASEDEEYLEAYFTASRIFR